MRSPYLHLTLIRTLYLLSFLTECFVSCFVFLYISVYVARKQVCFGLEMFKRAGAQVVSATWLGLTSWARVGRANLFLYKFCSGINIYKSTLFWKKIPLLLMRPNGSKLSRNNSTSTCFYDSNRDCFKITQFKVPPAVLCGISGGSEPLKLHTFRHLKTFKK